MNVSEYNYLVNNPESINDRQTQDLERVIQDFPYFQSAHALSLKGLYNQNSFKYNYALKIAAAHTADRSMLFDFITSDDFTTINYDPYDQKLSGLWDLPVNNVESVSGQNPEKDAVPISIIAPEITSSPQTEEPFIVAETSLVPEAHESNVGSDVATDRAPDIVNAKLDIGKPLNFTSHETHSFAEWLQLSSFRPIDRTKDLPVEQLPETHTEKQKKMS